MTIPEFIERLVEATERYDLKWIVKGGSGKIRTMDEFYCCPITAISPSGPGGCENVTLVCSLIGMASCLRDEIIRAVDTPSQTLNLMGDRRKLRLKILKALKLDEVVR